MSRSTRINLVPSNALVTGTWFIASLDPNQVVQVIALIWKAARKIISGMEQKVAAIWHSVEISI
jgi:hypothetical protein